MSIRVLLADDEAMVRAGLRLVLESEPDIDVVGEASDGVETLAKAARLRPDVVLIDVHMPRMDGLSAAHQLLVDDPGIKVVVLTTFNDNSYVREALRLGASGFLLKVAPPERLAEAVRVAARGDALLDPLVTRGVIESFVTEPGVARGGDREPPSGLDLLTARELEVFHLLAQGKSNAEIAEEFVVAEATVKTHVAHVLAKLHLRDRVQAVVLAYENDLVHPDPKN
jgi:DNA-binding NarL/FixJ family response regulator